MPFIDKLAVVYKLSIDIKHEKYILIGHTYDLMETKKGIIEELQNNRHGNRRLQEKYNKLLESDPKHIGLYLNFESLQSLRPSYYPKNVLPLLMEQLEKSFINSIYDDYKNQGKEYLILNIL